MQIVRLISQDHMNNKQYVGKADFLVFRAMSQHGFLGQLQDKKLVSIVQNLSQMLNCICKLFLHELSNLLLCSPYSLRLLHLLIA
ncbi:PREDICTED: mediator of RNA polymerase II transcription subunit 25-like [Camelina sativa]|uniref:Mediator of RNA polymerase II transcription subunit 25-like n=1 Tax=Camelina sativa TaxID=90675 RepID=A0ABM1RJM3_CAMSA|nr:PREDICTED: mediator of RNA polymerase II transcription subunit 25-like [Camelina sativa]